MCPTSAKHPTQRKAHSWMSGSLPSTSIGCAMRAVHVATMASALAVGLMLGSSGTTDVATGRTLLLLGRESAPTNERGGGEAAAAGAIAAQTSMVDDSNARRRT